MGTQRTSILRGPGSLKYGYVTFHTRAVPEN